MFEWDGVYDLSTSIQIAQLDASYAVNVKQVTEAKDPNAQTSNKSAAEIAWELNRDLNLRSTGNYYYNWAGRSEKWISGNSGIWYFILPDGAVYEWDGNFNLDSSFEVATLNSTYHVNPSLLTEATDPNNGLSLTNDTGAKNNDLITSDGRLTLSNVRDGATVEYSTDGGSTWSSNFNAVEGVNDLLARQTDGSGTTALGYLTFTLDTSTTTPVVSLANDTGSSYSDKLTKNGLLALANIEDGASVEYSVNGGNNWSGAFSAAEGANTVHVRQTDLAGNVSQIGVLTFTLDSTAAGAPGVSLANDTGASNTDKVTTDGQLSLTNIEAGAAIEYSINGGNNWTGSFTAAEGSNTVRVRQTDAAGNVSASGTLTFTLQSGVNLAQLAWDAKQEYQFTYLGTGFDGIGGLNEKWLADKNDLWYYMLPTGKVLKYNGVNLSPDNDQVIVTLDNSYYVDITKLTNAVQP